MSSCSTGGAGRVPRGLTPRRFTTPSNPVTVYSDGSERTDTQTTTTGFAVIDFNGYILSVGAGKLETDGDYLSGEFEAFSRGIKAASTIPNVTELCLITDNTCVAETIRDGENPPKRTRRVAERTRKAFIDAEKNCETVEIFETDRRLNKLADSLATFAHHQTFDADPTISS